MVLAEIHVGHRRQVAPRVGAVSMRTRHILRLGLRESCHGCALRGWVGATISTTRLSWACEGYFTPRWHRPSRTLYPPPGDSRAPQRPPVYLSLFSPHSSLCLCACPSDRRASVANPSSPPASLLRAPRRSLRLCVIFSRITSATPSHTARAPPDSIPQIPSGSRNSPQSLSRRD